MKNIYKIIRIAMLVTAMTLPGVALAEQLPSFDRASFGSVVLSDSQTFDSDTELELSIGNYQNEPIVNYSESSVFSKILLKSSS